MRRIVDDFRDVAPFAGAWIETGMKRGKAKCGYRRPLRGGVDRNVKRINAQHGRAPGRPLRGGVDRNSHSRIRLTLLPAVAPFAGAWIETASLRAPSWHDGSRPLRGGVDRNVPVNRQAGKRGGVAPFAGAWIETQ